MGGRYCHQTSSLFTIITKHIAYTTGRQQKRKGETEKDKNYMKIYRREKSSLYQGKKRIYTKEHIYKKKKKQKKNTQHTTTDIHNNENKLRKLYTGNIHPTPTHMIAEPFDSSVRMK